jgi:hypothetical protein
VYTVPLTLGHWTSDLTVGVGDVEEVEVGRVVDGAAGL